MAGLAWTCEYGRVGMALRVRPGLRGPEGMAGLAWTRGYGRLAWTRGYGRAGVDL